MAGKSGILAVEDCMTIERIGILHPGQMGVSLAAAVMRAGHKVYYASAGRSQQTQTRAQQNGLQDARSLAELCRNCSVIISVCPPHAADDVAGQVLGHSFRGLYLDANAISPQRAVQMGEKMEAQGIAFVDGGIIGGPAWEPGRTWLYLSGREADRAAACFSKGPLEVSIVGNQIGRASALKMCYAAYSKGTTALLAGILARAEFSDVRNVLYQQWERDERGFAGRAEQRVRRVTAKAWRFAGEMEEIAATFRQAGLPDGFHLAAADIYRRMESFKDAQAAPEPAEIISKILS